MVLTGRGQNNSDKEGVGQFKECSSTPQDSGLLYKYALLFLC